MIVFDQAVRHYAQDQISIRTIMKTALILILGTLLGLYVVYKIIETLDRRARRRCAEDSRRRGEDGICRWGISADGELIHVRAKRPSPDN